MNDAPCGAGPSRWRARHGCAYADGSREPAPGAGCSAGRSACPWPRLYLLVVWQSLSGGHAYACTQTNATARYKLWSRSKPARSRIPVAAVSPRTGDCSRVLTELPLVKPPCRTVHRRRDEQPSQPSRASRAPLYQRDQNVAERLAPAPKTVSFCQSRFSTGRRANQLAGAQAGVSPDDTELLGLTAGPSSCADMLRDEDDCPVHTCG